MLLRSFPSRDEFQKLAWRGNVIPVCREILADTETPLSVLAKVYHDAGPVFLLESVEGGERWGRYSFLGASAKAQIRMFKDRVEILEGERTLVYYHDGEPFDVLRSFMGRFKPVVLPDLPRFWGGLVGYLAYETVSFFESVPVYHDEQEPLARFVLPDRLFIFDNVRHTLTLVSYAFVDEVPTEEAFDVAQASLDAMQSQLAQHVPEPPCNASETCNLEASLAPETFRSQVSRVKQYIEAGDVIQAVISQPFVCKDPVHPWWLYRAQRYVNPSPYLFFLHLDDVVLVGSSPETMVRLENGIATLRPIAGTRPRGNTEQADRKFANELLQDPKERAEHLMLVDLGRNDLGRVALVGTVQVTDLMVVERYSHVMHMVTNITCDLRSDRDAWDLIRATFPAGTLTGAPKIRAMEIIAEMEQESRGPYGGAIGYISFTGNMDLAITIRTACYYKGCLTVRAGAGIVAESDPERERVETVNKAMAIQRALQLVRKGGVS